MRVQSRPISDNSKHWCVEFWDSDGWDEWANTRRSRKAEAVALAQDMNRRWSHEDRKAFGGHRFRVRKVK